MAKARKKSELPHKICPQCNRPFTWRKKWGKNWEAVKYCSARCRGDAKTWRLGDEEKGELGERKKG